MKTYPIPEHQHTINGVSGRMFAIQEPQEIRGKMVYRGQKWCSVSRPAKYYSSTAKLYVEIRFDDECKNGHQSFAITGTVIDPAIKRGDKCLACGCLHDDIAAIFPELAPLIKWHLTSTDGPMHYIGNTVYHAGDRDYNGRRKGEPSAWQDVIYFGNSPVAHKLSPSFAKFISDRTGDFNTHEIAHENKQGGYQFSPKYTLAGYGERWHECPFDDRATAEQWQKGLNNGDFRLGRIVTAYAEGKERDFDAARSCAAWPDATNEELSAEPEVLKQVLADRLPALIAGFRADMENAGFLWEPSNEVKQ